MDEKQELISSKQKNRGCCTPLRLLILCTIIVVILAAVLLVLLLRVDDKERVEKSTSYSRAAVTSDSPECSTIGKEILKRGGSTVDAAIAATLCVGVMGSVSSGIGGGSFMVIYEKPRGQDTPELNTLDFREVAPSNVTATYSYKGSSSIGVPGEMAGYWAAWQRYGRLPWADLLQPTIDLCKNGFKLHKYLAGRIEWAATQEPPKECQPMGTMNDYIYKPDGSVYKHGDIVTLPKLAATLEKIAKAETGADEFYKGLLSQDVSDDLKEIGSNITLEDLRSYKPIWRKPLVFKITTGSSDTFQLATLPAPSGGPVLNLILNIMTNLNYQCDDTLNYHWLVESFKFAYGLRTGLADPEFVDIAGLQGNMTSKGLAELLSSKIDAWRTHNPDYYMHYGNGSYDAGTSQINVLNENAAVSITSSVNGPFGSQCAGPRTGILFNNIMADFNTDPTSANYPEAGKRPLSAMTPVIVFDDKGQVAYVLGAAGGTHIISTVANVLWQSLFKHTPIAEAANMPRLHNKLFPDVTEYDIDFPKPILDGLANKGHNLHYPNRIVSYCNAIEVKCHNNHNKMADCVSAVTDKTKDGSPDGY